MPRRELKKPRRSEMPPDEGKKPRLPSGTDLWPQQSFRWRVNDNYIDMEHEEWGWGDLPINEFFDILKNSLQKYEDMSWHDLLNRSSCHPMPLHKIERRARERLRARFPDIDTLHQVDFSELGRVWGVKKGQYFQLVWHDPYHTVYPTRRR
ncbi:hypothetical protein ACFLTK_02950 [Chloroflexota bacterium]